MKKLKYLILFILLVSCNNMNNINTKKEKPFIIINIADYHELNGKVYCRYMYQDKNGTTLTFYDEQGLYHVGDTLK